MPPPRLRTLLRLLTLLLLGALVGGWPAHAQVPAMAVLHLSEARPTVDLWPALRVRVDPGGALDWRSALAHLPDFSAPTGHTNNFGHQREPVWLSLPLQADDGDGQWVFDLDYPPFNEVTLYLVSDGRLVTQVQLGSRLAREDRPMHARTHAATLDLEPGRGYQLLVRLRTDSAMLLPLTLSKPDAYWARESLRLVEQGLVFGVTLALLAYCVVHGLGMRDPLFGLYGALLLGSAAFFVDFFGLGQLFLWSERTGMTAMVSPLSVMLAMAAGGAFVMRALDTRRFSPRLHRGLLALSGTSGVLLLAGVLGGLDYRSAQWLATLIGPFVPLLAIPAAWRRARSGERKGLFMLLGWTIYVAGATSMACLLRGWLPANVWTLHLYQWASPFEMLAWLRVLGLHMEEVRVEAQRDAAAVRDLSAMARTDALTGLPNRRGLELALEEALGRATPQSLLGIFMIDLDGFKAANDQHGHAVGDRILVEVGRRMVGELRRNDVVARLGGDEFVVLTEGLHGEDEAVLVGRKLLDAFAQPLLVAETPCRIGLTIGFAMAPTDGRVPADLLRMADAAMYAGKRAGRHRMHRGTAMALSEA